MNQVQTETRRTPVIGIVGGLASGKSTVARLLEARGACAVDADRIGHEVLELPEVRHSLTEAFGGGILGADSRIDREQLAAAVFGRPEQVRRLNDIVHPIIIRKMREEMVRLQAHRDVPLVVLDVALLMETQLHGEMCRALLFVNTPEDLRRRRAAETRGMTAEQFAARERAQLPTDVKAAEADFTVNNTGSIE